MTYSRMVVATSFPPFWRSCCCCGTVSGFRSIVCTDLYIVLLMMGRIGSATKTAQYILMRNGAANRGASLAHGRQSDADADWIADADDKPLRSFSFVSSASAPSARLPVFLIIIEYAAMMMPLLAAWLLCLLQNLSSDGCGLFSCRQSSLMVRCLLYNQCQPP